MTLQYSVFEENEGGVPENVDNRHETRNLGTLQKTNTLMISLGCAQAISSFVALGFLSDRAVRTGWSQSLGAVASIACGLDGVASVAARAADLLPSLRPRVASFVVCVLSYAGLIALVTNTEDSQHDTAIDAVEAAACFFVLAWAFLLARIVGGEVEGEAKSETTFELRLRSNPL